MRQGGDAGMGKLLDLVRQLHAQEAAKKATEDAKQRMPQYKK